MPRRMNQNRESCRADSMENLLTFAKRVSQKNRHFALLQCVSTKGDNFTHHLILRRKKILGPPKGCLHHQHIRLLRLTHFCRRTPPQFEISCVKKPRLSGTHFSFHPNHGRSQDMSCGKKRQTCALTQRNRFPKWNLPNLSSLRNSHP